MTRTDVALNRQAKLVIFRERNALFLRFLVPKGGTPTFVTHKLPIGKGDLERLARREPCVLDLGAMTLTTTEHSVAIQAGVHSAWGSKQRLRFLVAQAVEG